MTSNNMPPKTEWGTPQLEIQRSDTWEPVKVREVHSLGDVVNAEVLQCLKEANRMFIHSTGRIKLTEAAYRFLFGRRLPAERVRTGIAPKWHNRTRRKQRLTRLQRRAKRQKH